MALAARHTGLYFTNVLCGIIVYALLFFDQPVKSAAANTLAAKAAIQHRTTGYYNGRQVHTTGAHDSSRCGLVTTGEQYYAINGIGADAFFHIHAHEVTE